MAPLVGSFHPSQLEERIKYKPDGKLRKPPVDLRECELKELIQFSCDLNGPQDDPRSRADCQPILRLFRQCANGLTVETTAWDGIYGKKKEKASEGGEVKKST